MWRDTRAINTAVATTVLTQEISLTDRRAKLQKSVCTTSQTEVKSLHVRQRRYLSKCFRKRECQCGTNKTRHAGQTNRNHSYAKPSEKRGEEKRSEEKSISWSVSAELQLIHLFHSHLGGFKWTHRTEIREPYGS